MAKINFVSLSAGVEGKDAKLENTYVRLADLGYTGSDSKKYIALSNLYTAKSTGRSAEETKIKSLSDFEKMIKNTNIRFVYYDVNGQRDTFHKTKTGVQGEVTVVYDPKNSASREDNAKTELREYKLENINLKQFVKYEIDGVEKVEQLPGSEIFYMDATGEHSLQGLGYKQIEDIKKNHKETLHIKKDGKEYKLTDIDYQELIAENDVAVESAIAADAGETGESGEAEVAEENTSRYMTFQKASKLGKNPIIIAENYQASPDGEFALVTLQRSYCPTMVHKSRLFNAAHEPIFEEDGTLRPGYKAQTLYVQLDSGEFSPTNVVREADLKNTYDEITPMNETTAQSDICGEETYLYLRSGEFVKESEVVRPIAYDYAATKEDQKNPDAYLFSTSDGKSFIVNKLGPVVIEKNRYDATKDNCIPLKKSSKKLKDCAVIQTTNENYNDKFYECEVLRERDNTALSDIDTRLERAKGKFTEQYKQNKYLINSVFITGDDGKLIEEELRDNTRYKLSGEVILNDVAAKSRDACYFQKHPLHYENGKLKSGPKFSIWKYFKNHVALSAEIMLYSAAAGMMGVLISPVLPLIGFGIAAAALPVTAVVGLVNKIKVQGRRGYRFKDKIKKNRKAWTKEVTHDMQKIAENYQHQHKQVANYAKISSSKEIGALLEALNGVTDGDFATFKSENKKDLKKFCHGYKKKSYEEIQTELTAKKKSVDAKYSDLKKDCSLENFEREVSHLKNRMAAISTTIYQSRFELKNGKAEVNYENIVAYEEYRARLKEKKKDYKEALKDLKHGKRIQEEVDLVRDELKEMQKNYLVVAHKASATKEYNELKSRVEIAESFLHEKLYGDEATKEALKDITYDVKNGKFLYKHKAINKQEIVEFVTVEKKKGKQAVKVNIIKKDPKANDKKREKAPKKYKVLETKQFDVHDKIKKSKRKSEITYIESAGEKAIVEPQSFKNDEKKKVTNESEANLGANNAQIAQEEDLEQSLSADEATLNL